MTETETAGQRFMEQALENTRRFGRPARLDTGKGDGERAVSVWQVTELDGTRKRHCFVLATSAKEAGEVVGQRPEIIGIRQICAITQLPGDKYRPVLIADKKGGEVVVASDCALTSE